MRIGEQSPPNAALQPSLRRGGFRLWRTRCSADFMRLRPAQFACAFPYPPTANCASRQAGPSPGKLSGFAAKAANHALTAPRNLPALSHTPQPQIARPGKRPHLRRNLLDSPRKLQIRGLAGPRNLPALSRIPQPQIARLGKRPHLRRNLLDSPRKLQIRGLAGPLYQPPRECERAEALSRFHRPRRRVRRGGFCIEKIFFQREIVPQQFPRRKLAKMAGGAESAGFCGFGKGKIAAPQIENLRRNAQREDTPPVRQLAKNLFRQVEAVLLRNQSVHLERGFQSGCSPNASLASKGARGQGQRKEAKRQLLAAWGNWRMLWRCRTRERYRHRTFIEFRHTIGLSGAHLLHGSAGGLQDGAMPQAARQGGKGNV